MQLNVYVPKDKLKLLQKLDAATKRTGKQKNELVLEALEAYLEKTQVAEEKPVWKTYDLGVIGNLSREEIYDDEFFERILGQLPDDPAGR